MSGNLLLSLRFLCSLHFDEVVDKVVFMFDGLILEIGHPEVMFSNPQND